MCLQPHEHRPPDGGQSPVIWLLTLESTLWGSKIKDTFLFPALSPFPASPHVCFNNCLPPSLILTPSFTAPLPPPRPLFFLSSEPLATRAFVCRVALY